MKERGREVEEGTEIVGGGERERERGKETGGK